MSIIHRNYYDNSPFTILYKTFAFSEIKSTGKEQDNFNRAWKLDCCLYKINITSELGKKHNKLNK